MFSGVLPPSLTLYRALKKSKNAHLKVVLKKYYYYLDQNDQKYE